MKKEEDRVLSVSFKWKVCRKGYEIRKVPFQWEPSFVEEAPPENILSEVHLIQPLDLKDDEEKNSKRIKLKDFKECVEELKIASKAKEVDAGILDSVLKWVNQFGPWEESALVGSHYYWGDVGEGEVKTRINGTVESFMMQAKEISRVVSAIERFKLSKNKGNENSNSNLKKDLKRMKATLSVVPEVVVSGTDESRVKLGFLPKNLFTWVCLECLKEIRIESRVCSYCSKVFNIYNDKRSLRARFCGTNCRVKSHLEAKRKRKRY